MIMQQNEFEQHEQQHQQNGNFDLHTAINCLSYGLSCFIYIRQKQTLHQCTISIHEQFINILHIIISRKASYLVKLNQLESISQKDQNIEKSLAKYQLKHYLILFLASRTSIVFATYSQSEKKYLKLGLQFFKVQGTNFYKKTIFYDPFKSQARSLFLAADADGGKLLDIEEIVNILSKLKVNKTRDEIQSQIQQINSHLYEKDNLQKPNGFTLDQLTPLGFQNLLRFYSLKPQIAKYFSAQCPIFKMKKKSHKVSIIDILKNNQKPLMSSYQLSLFYAHNQHETKNQQQCEELIKSFPTYDGEGREKDQEVTLLSFNNFCNLLFSEANSIMHTDITKQFHNMKNPINDYWIYTTIIPSKFNNNVSKLQVIQFAIRKGARAFNLYIEEGAQGVPMLDKTTNLTLLQALTSLKRILFHQSCYPLWIQIDCKESKALLQKVCMIFKKLFPQNLVLQDELTTKDSLPSPFQLKNKIILMGDFIKQKNSTIVDINLSNQVLAFKKTKVDYEMKNQHCWNYCHVDESVFKKYEDIQGSRINTYCRGMMMKVSSNGQGNTNPIIMIRNGVQMTAINHQQTQEANYLVHSLFLENKNCGYLLKPHWMQSQCLQARKIQSFEQALYEINLQIICGQKCVLNESKQSKFYLQVFLKGIKQQQENKNFRSQYKTEGLYSEIMLNCNFKIYCLDLAVICFHFTDGKQILAGRAIRVKNMRQGIRSVALMDKNLQLVTNSYLLVYFKKKEIQRQKVFMI